jgi:translocation and assembly module TamB
VSGTGTIDLFIDRYPRLDLKATLTDNKLLIFPFQYLKVRGKLHAYGEEMPYRVDGDLFVESALSREPVLNQVRERGRRTVRFMPSAASSDEGSSPLFSLNIRGHADRGVFVKNDLFDAELKGDLTVINTIAAPRLMGWAEVIGGKMLFKDQGFQIQSARMDFDNPTAINPKFNLTATTEVASTRVRLYVAGLVSDYKVDLTSDPALSKEQIISLLALGFTTDDLTKMKPADRGAIQQSEAASLLLYSLDFNREVQEKTGLRIQVEESVDSQQGNSIFRPQTSQTNDVASPKIVIKRSIGKRVDLSVGSTVGVGTNTEREVNAEFKVTPGMSVIGVWDEYEGVTAQDQFTSYGVDLKLQKRFK